MCKETFLRLPEEKRRRFLEAAWGEFTRVKFADVSINQIVRQAGVPRGSFYQYFADKEDLFVYLLRTAQARFLEKFYLAVEAAHGDLFQAQMDCYDRLQDRQTQEPLVECGMQLLRINATDAELQNVPLWQPEAVVVGDMQRRMDLRRFVRRDADFVQQVVALTLLALGAALTASLGHPECAAEHRRRLAQQMEIIRRGAERPETACKGGAV